MEPIKIGVVGTGRGKTFMRQNTEVTGLKLAAICSRHAGRNALCKEWYDKDGTVETYTDYDEMLEKADIDAVVVCNYFHEHAPFAIKALKAGKHVLSECLAAGTLGEAVALCRAVEESGKIYMFAENYPFNKNRLEMKRLYESGELGELIYGEGEYCHPISNPVYAKISPGEYHWRNQFPCTYYCTHAIAPVMYITNTMPVRVNGFAAQLKDQSYRGADFSQNDPGGIIMCQMDNGAVVRTLQTGFRVSSGITTLHCTKGLCEVDRNTGDLNVIHESADRGDHPRSRTYAPEWPEHGELAAGAGHGGGDFWVSYLFGQAIRKNEQPWLNVYRGCAMSAIGILAWKSVINGGQAYDVPKFDDEEDRKKYENDFWSPFFSEGEDRTGKPPTAVSWTPPEGALEEFTKVWEKAHYYGLGWSEEDVERAEELLAEYNAKKAQQQ